MGNSAGSGLVLEEGFGYRVIQILPDSPAHEAGNKKKKKILLYLQIY
jgi:hypothetical protein